MIKSLHVITSKNLFSLLLSLKDILLLVYEGFRKYGSGRDELVINHNVSPGFPPQSESPACQSFGRRDAFMDATQYG